MSVSEPTNTTFAAASALQVTGKCSSTRGRGCRIGRGLPLQQRKAYRNLARQTPRVQGLTFDHNQIRWISYWKNEQNKQVQKHFPVSRYGFLGARRMALEERNKIMGRPPDADEAAEAIANLKIDPSIPCFLEWNSPSQHDEVQAVEVDDEGTASAEVWQDEEFDSSADAYRSETTDLITISPVIPTELLTGHLHHVDVVGPPPQTAVHSAIVACHGAPKQQSVGPLDSSEFLHPSFHSVGACKRADFTAAFRGEGKRYALTPATEMFPRSCKLEEVNDEFMARSMTRTTTAAPDTCVDRFFMATDCTTFATAAGFDETEIPPDVALPPIPQAGHRHTRSDTEPATPFQRPMPPALSPRAIAFEDKFMSYEFSIDTGPMSIFCTTDGPAKGRLVRPDDIETVFRPACDAFISGEYLSPCHATSDTGSPTGLARASSMREVFDFCDSRKALCSRLIHDLFQGVRSSAIISPKGSSSSEGAGVPSADMRYRDFLENEEATHSLAIEDAKGPDQLEPYLEIFRHCLVAGLMPSQLPLNEKIAMVWTLHRHIPIGWKSNPNQQLGAVSQTLNPFRERQGMTHRLLIACDGANANPNIPFDLHANGAVGINSPAATGRASAFIPPPSLFFGPAHAPSSPTAALYGGVFAKAAELENYFAFL